MNEDWVQGFLRVAGTSVGLSQHQETLVRLAKIPRNMRTSGQQAWVTRCSSIEHQWIENANANKAVYAVRELSELERKAVAQCVNIKYKRVLLDLAHDTSEVVRWNLARNPSISQSVIEVLANDACRDVRNCLILNPATPEKVVAKLARRDLECY